MKTIYTKRNDLFRDINMVLFNNITEVDESFIGDNFDLFFTPTDDDDINEEIERLSQIDWEKEEYKPYDIEDTMTREEIKAHLNSTQRENIDNDLENHECEPYQYFACNIDDYQKEELSSWGIEVGYSEKCGLSIIPIYDFGTSWDMFSYSKEVEDDYQLGYRETEKRSTVY
jgi:hypothetical protein